MDPMIRTTDKPECPVCGTQGEMLHDGLKDQLFGAPGDWSIRRCSRDSCGLFWLDPRPIENDIARAYQTYYTHANAEEKSLVKSYLVACIRDLMVNAVTWFCGQRAEKQDIAHMYLRDMPPGKVLDIGCGDARFLNRMKQLGWSVQGVDFDAAAASNAKTLFDIDVQIGTLQNLKFPEDSFDAITMNHVIEHVFHPVSLLREVRRILRPGGRLVVVTPNAASMGHRVFGRFWRGLEPPRHIQIFTPAALEAVTNSARLRIDKVSTTAVNAWIIFSASFVLKRRNGTNALGDVKPKRSEQIEGLKMQVAEASSLKNSHAEGEEIVLIATKT